MEYSGAWGHFAAHAVVTFMRDPCETSKAVVINTWTPKGIWPLAYNEENHQLKSPNFVDNLQVFTIESSHAIIFQ